MEEGLFNGIIDCIAKAWMGVGVASSPRTSFTERRRPGRSGGDVNLEDEGAKGGLGEERSNSEPKRAVSGDDDFDFVRAGVNFWRAKCKDVVIPRNSEHTLFDR